MTMPPDLPSPPADAVEATVAALCELKRRSGITLAIAIGRTVVEGIYDGDLARVRDRHADCPTLRAIATHPRVPFSLTALHQAIGVYDLVRRFPELPHTALTLTHLRLVLPYGDEVQRRLLRQALGGGWTTRELAEAARAVKPTRGKGGRPRLPRVVKTLNHLDRLAREDAAWADLDELAGLPTEQRVVLARRVAQLKRHLRGVELRLEGEGDARFAVDGEGDAPGAVEREGAPQAVVRDDDNAPTAAEGEDTPELPAGEP